MCDMLASYLNAEANGTFAGAAGRKFLAANHNDIVFRSVALMDDAVDACVRSEVTRSEDRCRIV